MAVEQSTQLYLWQSGKVVAVGGRDVDVHEARISGVHCIESHVNHYLHAPPHGKVGASHVVGTNRRVM